MAIYVNLGDSEAVDTAIDMMNSGIKGSDVSIDLSAHDGTVVARPHEKEGE